MLLVDLQKKFWVQSAKPLFFMRSVTLEGGQLRGNHLGKCDVCSIRTDNASHTVTAACLEPFGMEGLKSSCSTAGRAEWPCTTSDSLKETNRKA